MSVGGRRLRWTDNCVCVELVVSVFSSTRRREDFGAVSDLAPTVRHALTCLVRACLLSGPNTITAERPRRSGQKRPRLHDYDEDRAFEEELKMAKKISKLETKATDTVAAQSNEQATQSALADQAALIAKKERQAQLQAERKKDTGSSSKSPKGGPSSASSSSSSGRAPMDVDSGRGSDSAPPQMQQQFAASAAQAQFSSVSTQLVSCTPLFCQAMALTEPALKARTLVSLIFKDDASTVQEGLRTVLEAQRAGKAAAWYSSQQRVIRLLAGAGDNITPVRMQIATRQGETDKFHLSIVPASLSSSASRQLVTSETASPPPLPLQR